MGVIRFMCDDVHVMLAGEIVEFGPAVEVFERAEHPYTRKLIQAAFLKEIDVH